MSVFRVLIIKTAALGDVLRTTSILPGLAARYGDGLRVTWLTAKGALPLVDGHPLIDEVIGLDLKEAAAVEAAGDQLAGWTWDCVLSFDDEQPLCALATRLGAVTGAYLTGDGERAYTADVGPWFDMGLLSVHGKTAADRLKVANERSHPEIFAGMLGIEIGAPSLGISTPALERAHGRLEGLAGPLIGLNTGAGGRWTSKTLPEQRVLELAVAVDRALAGDVRPTFVLLGGPEERERHRRLFEALSRGVQVFDATCENSLLDFAGLVDGLDLLVTSDSLALHMAIARKRPVVAFFAPTSAAEIELYGRGTKVASTADDYCSYQKDADRSTLTVERLLDAVLENLP